MKKTLGLTVLSLWIVVACNDESRAPTEATLPNARAVGGSPVAEGAAGNIGAGEVHLSGDHLETSTTIRAFIPTESSSSLCLATLGETTIDPRLVRSIWCGTRTVGGVEGVLVSIFFTNPVPSSVSVAVTILQSHAREYGTPVLFTGS